MRLFVVALYLGMILVGTPGLCDPPAGYYLSAEGKWGEALKTALHNIIQGHDALSYNGAKDEMWGSIDNVNGQVRCRYLGEWRTTSTRDTLGTNTEHTWPQSQGTDVLPKRSDLHHLFIVDEGMNSRRGNTPYGNVSNPDYEDGGTKIDSNIMTEPRDDFKGDVARALLYMDVRYTELSLVKTGENLGTNQMGYLDDLMNWNELDPVSQEERDRNDSIYALQDNRNPFVDHPEYVLLVYGDVTPTPTKTATPPATATPWQTPSSTATATLTPTYTPVPRVAVFMIY